MTNVVLLIYTTTLVVALPMKESLKEFHCKIVQIITRIVSKTQKHK